MEDSERTFELGASVTNAVGNAEHLGANIEYGTENSHTASVSYKQPRAFGLPLLVRAGAWHASVRGGVASR